MKTISEKAQYYVIPMKIRFFFCLHSPPTPVSGHPMHNNLLLAMKFVFILQINKNMTFYRATEQLGSVLSNLNLSTEKPESDITFVVSHYGHVRYGLLSSFLFYII